MKYIKEHLASIYNRKIEDPSLDSGCCSLLYSLAIIDTKVLEHIEIEWILFQKIDTF